MKRLRIGILLLAIVCSATAADRTSYEAALAKGNQLLEDEQYALAAEVLDEAITSLRAEQGGDTLDTVYLLLPAAKAYADLGKESRGYRYFDKAIKLLEQASDDDQAELVVSAFSLRESAEPMLDARRKNKQLIILYELATEILGDRDLRVASMATELGSIAISGSRKTDAVVYLDQAYAVLKNVEFIDPDPIGIELLTLATEYVHVDRMETANELLGLAMAIGASSNGPTPITRMAPIYPNSCLRAAINGEVNLIFGVDDNGSTVGIEVSGLKIWRGKKILDSSSDPCGKDFELAAINAVARFRYIPNLVDGVPLASEGVITTVSFEVEGRF
jgi:tetratricopeptide (TPR) repeat protein